MLTVYGTDLCPDCRACKTNFDAYGIEYNYLSINEKLRYLKDFLILRDSEPVFDHLKAIHDIGIPAIVLEDGKVITDWEGYVESLGHKVLPEGGTDACCTDHKGC
jgi:glutaredoxin-related protein